MDQKTATNAKIQRLISQSDAARTTLGGSIEKFRHRLDFPSRVRSSLKKNPSFWLLGSLASGFAGSLIFWRKPAIQEKQVRGKARTLLGLALVASRPLIKAWLAGQLKQWILGLARTQQESHSASFPTSNPKSR